MMSKNGRMNILENSKKKQTVFFYVHNHTSGEILTLRIEAKNFNSSERVLVQTVMHPENWKLITERDQNGKSYA